MKYQHSKSESTRVRFRQNVNFFFIPNKKLKGKPRLDATMENEKDSLHAIFVIFYVARKISA